MTESILEERALVRWLQHFVRTPSQQSDQQEADPHVLSFIRDCASPLLTKLGLVHRLDDRGNLICEAGPRESGRSLLLAAYAMTHPAAGMQDPFAATVIDTQAGPAVRGRGVAEQKSALTAALAAFAQAVRGGTLDGWLVFTLLTAGETGRHDAIESVMADLGRMPQAAVICVGTGNRVAVGNKGRVDFDIIIHGRAAHSSQPWQGVNAITGARLVLEQLERFAIRTPPHPAFGPATLTPTAIESWPRATHTIQDKVRITCDRRLLPGEDPQAAYAEIARAVDLGPPWSLEWRRGPVMFANELAPEARLYRIMSEAQRAAALPADSFHCDFALDAGYFGRQGIEAAMFGPGHVDQFHSSEETVPVADLVAAARAYHAMIGSAVCRESASAGQAP